MRSSNPSSSPEPDPAAETLELLAAGEPRALLRLILADALAPRGAPSPLAPPWKTARLRRLERLARHLSDLRRRRHG